MTGRDYRKVAAASEYATAVIADEIAIPEIQRPFVWEPVKVRDLLDSLYKGYLIGC
jgi:uncharacterized protein with ParB-like and HNH nuclease domain